MGNGGKTLTPAAQMDDKFSAAYLADEGGVPAISGDAGGPNDAPSGNAIMLEFPRPIAENAVRIPSRERCLSG